MSMMADLQHAMATLDIPAEWVGMRAVKETETRRWVSEKEDYHSVPDDILASATLPDR